MMTRLSIKVKQRVKPVTSYRNMYYLLCIPLRPVGELVGGVFSTKENADTGKVEFINKNDDALEQYSGIDQLQVLECNGPVFVQCAYDFYGEPQNEVVDTFATLSEAEACVRTASLPPKFTGDDDYYIMTYEVDQVILLSPSRENARSPLA
jgi:hypothetical protein